MRRDVFQAIADPTRRDIVKLLAHQALSMNEVAEKFDVSRPAISKHIKILTECGLISIRQVGRERYCQTMPKKLKEVADWADYFSQFWDEKLLALKNHIENKNQDKDES